MSILLEIIGRGIAVDTAEVIWTWFELGPLSKEARQSPRYEKLYDAIGLIRQDRTKDAQEQLRLYLFDHPTCSLARLAAGAFCIKLNQIPQAVQELNSVYMRQPSNTMALYALGYCYERLGKEAEAIEFYQDCLKFKSFLQLPRQRLAAIYFKNGQLEKTIQQYELLRGEYPDDAFTLVALGNLYIVAGQYERAIETFSTAILIHPDNFTDQDDQTERLIRDGRVHEALELIEQQLQDWPDRADLFIRQADAFALLNLPDQAAASYERALRICPDLLEATIKLGTQYLLMQQDELAARQFNHAFEINDQIVDAYIGLAAAQNLLDRTQDALATLSLAAAIQPNSALLFAHTASLQFKTGLALEAESHWQGDKHVELEAILDAHHQQLALEPDNPELHYRTGVLAMAAGDLPQAAKAFENALHANATFDRARAKLIVCLHEANQKDAALTLLPPPALTDPQTLQLHYRTALLYCDKFKFAGSLLNLQNFMQNNFATRQAAHDVAIVLQNLGLLDRATAVWENLAQTVSRTTDTDPDSLCA